MSRTRDVGRISLTDTRTIEKRCFGNEGSERTSRGSSLVITLRHFIAAVTRIRAALDWNIRKCWCSTGATTKKNDCERRKRPRTGIGRQQIISTISVICSSTCFGSRVRRDVSEVHGGTKRRAYAYAYYPSRVPRSMTMGFSNPPLD
ncbi:uncharacterized protein [Cardiocondyla obscurior]|uniref:uncharacterized protein n=1 Tax=Cardiocondyla obscurior TaxID=286306 RepID=UPI0039658655